MIASVRASRQLPLLGRYPVPFVEKEHMMFYRREAMAEHPNGMKFHAFDAEGQSLREARYLSVGGGFVVTAGASNSQVIAAHDQLPYPFRTGRELLTMCRESGLSVAQLMTVSYTHLDVYKRQELDYRIIDTWQAFDAWMELAQGAELVALDTETTSLDERYV